MDDGLSATVDVGGSGRGGVSSFGDNILEQLDLLLGRERILCRGIGVARGGLGSRGSPSQGVGGAGEVGLGRDEVRCDGLRRGDLDNGLVTRRHHQGHAISSSRLTS